VSGAGPRHAERGGDRVRNLIRRRPLEVEEITFGDRPVRVPTRVEITRIKAWLCLLRNATRDPQVTRVGAVLCKYSLDELPQLFNVLTGTMSLIAARCPTKSSRPPTPSRPDVASPSSPA